MDALLKKHRGGGESDREVSPERTTASEPAAPTDAWLPVLTQVIERGTPPATSVPDTSPVVTAPAEPDVPAADVPPAAVSDTLAEQLMSELAPRLSEVMEKQVAAELRKNLDQTVATLLSQLDVNVREIVRDAVAEKLKQPRDKST
ncbi:MAG TPA: hypothetical protein VF501_05710 [Thiobacillus sp.]